jgi:hypothetical protein
MCFLVDMKTGYYLLLSKWNSLLTDLEMYIAEEFNQIDKIISDIKNAHVKPLYYIKNPWEYLCNLKNLFCFINM